MSLIKHSYLFKVFIHDSLYSLSNFIPTKTLPDEYGGEAGGKKEIIGEWQKKLLKNLRAGNWPKPKPAIIPG